jgi:hypothetical protein
MNSKIIPKVQFKIANLDSQIKDMIFFLTELSIEELQFQILSEYPALAAKLVTVNTNEDRARTITKFFIHNHKENRGKITKAQNNFQQTWDSIQEQFMTALSETLEIDWPEKYKEITANLSISPICPISIEDKEFNIFYKTKILDFRDYMFPRILAFLYNEKWKQIFPKEKFKFKNLAWILYEISTTAIIADSKIQNKFKYKNKPNPDYEKIIIGDNFLLNHIEKLYKNKTSFEDFLKKSWKFINTNKEKIEEQLE